MNDVVMNRLSNIFNHRMILSKLTDIKTAEPMNIKMMMMMMMIK